MEMSCDLWLSAEKGVHAYLLLCCSVIFVPFLFTVFIDVFDCFLCCLVVVILLLLVALCCSIVRLYCFFNNDITDIANNINVNN